MPSLLPLLQRRQSTRLPSPLMLPALVLPSHALVSVYITSSPRTRSSLTRLTTRTLHANSYEGHAQFQTCSASLPAHLPLAHPPNPLPPVGPIPTASLVLTCLVHSQCHFIRIPLNPPPPTYSQTLCNGHIPLDHPPQDPAQILKQSRC